MTPLHPAAIGVRVWGMSDFGRPSLYEPEFAIQAAAHCARGATDDELADLFNVNRSTIYRWKLEHEDFCNAVKTGKDLADERVERSLYQRATGYNVTEQQAIKVKVGQYEESVEVVDVQKHISASDTAAIFWLKNRRKDQWRDKNEVVHTGADGGPIQMIQRRVIDPNGDGTSE